MNRQLVALEDSDKEKDHILRVEWNIGKRCNYYCSYCNKDTHDDTSKFMEWDIYTNAIDQLLKFANGKPIKISFTGGEPFVHPKFIDMLKYAKDSGIWKCSCTTNGSPPPKIYNKAIKYLDYVVISYHFEFAYHEKIINNIVGMWDLMKEYRTASSWKDMHVHIMFLPGHLKECEEIIATLEDNNIKYAVRKIRPLLNSDMTGWNPTYTSGLLGHNVRKTDIKLYNEKQSYYTDEEEIWVRDNG